MSVITRFLLDNLGPVVALLLVFVLLGAFVIRFCVPAYRLGRELKLALRLLQARLSADAVNPEREKLLAVGKEIFPGHELAQRWQGFISTLHPRKAVDSLGQTTVVGWDLTVAPDLFFGSDLLETELDTEFFKHAPGIFTGLGILGTFLGLINGLKHFKVDIDPNIVQTQLENLINAVGTAFVVSAIAIFLAMLITALEKGLLVGLSKRLELLCLEIRAAFPQFTAIDRIERIVLASETSATQALHLKDALIGDLKQILEELVTTQAENSRNSFQHLTETMATAVTSSLEPSMAQIAKAVDRVTADQGTAVTSLLTDVLATFAQKLEGLVGSQMSGMGDLLQQTTAALLSTTNRFDQIALTMQNAGKAAVDEIGLGVHELLKTIDSRQELMTEMLTGFSDRLVSISTELERTLGENQERALGSMTRQTSDLLEGLRSEFAGHASSQVSAQQALLDGTREIVSGLNRNVEELLASTNSTSNLVRENIDGLSAVTSEAVGRIADGAILLEKATRDFAMAGSGISSAVKSTEETSNKLAQAAALLNQTFVGASAMVERQNAARDALASVVSELSTTIDNARRDAQLTSELVSRLEAASEHLNHAQLDVSAYLAKVNDVLVQAHEQFGSNVIKTLQRTSSAFHDDLTQAVGMLAATVKDLDDVLVNLPRAG